MKLYTTILNDSEYLISDCVEYFILPSYYDEKSVIEALASIRSKSWGTWKRLDRIVTSIETLEEDPEYKDFKYVSFTSHSKEGLVIFSKTVDHDCMYEVLNFMTVKEGEYFHHRLGAGFTDLVTCFGRSETLNLSSREEDTDLLHRCIDED